MGNINPFKSYLGLGVFRRAVKLIIYWKGSEEDWQEACRLWEHLSKYLKSDNDTERAMAQQYLEELRKREELSLSN